MPSEPIRMEKSFEMTDLSLKWVTLSTFLLVAVLFAIVFLTRFLFNYDKKQHQMARSAIGAVPNNFNVERKFPSPRLEASESDQLRRLRSYEDEILNNYGWEDRANGVVRIPVDEAIDRLLKQQSDSSLWKGLR